MFLSYFDIYYDFQHLFAIETFCCFSSVLQIKHAWKQTLRFLEEETKYLWLFYGLNDWGSSLGRIGTTLWDPSDLLSNCYGEGGFSSQRWRCRDMKLTTRLDLGSRVIDILSKGPIQGAHTVHPSWIPKSGWARGYQDITWRLYQRSGHSGSDDAGHGVSLNNSMLFCNSGPCRHDNPATGFRDS
jgi:hypothetical protein